MCRLFPPKIRPLLSSPGGNGASKSATNDATNSRLFRKAYTGYNKWVCAFDGEAKESEPAEELGRFVCPQPWRGTNSFFAKFLFGDNP